MNPVEIVGALAGTLTTIAFLPQVVKTWRSRSAEDISLFMFLLFNPHFSPGGEMIAQRFGFTRNFTPQGGTEVRWSGIPAVFSTEENFLWIQRSSEGSSSW
jgi:hypothetical protein